MCFFSLEIHESKNQEILHPILDRAEISLHLKREDLIHDKISGNKYRKLKYNLVEAKKLEVNKVLTFGGAYSNHISATAAAGKELGLQTIGIIRGEELGQDQNKTLSENDTLRFASSCGMKFKFISRTLYKDKESPVLLETLQKEFGSFYLVPEGGTNALAIKGCEEILSASDTGFDRICCAVGTGGTIAGIINASMEHQKVMGFPALKGSFLSEEIEKYTIKKNWSLVEKYHFGGYGKINVELVEFINTFYREQNIALDPIYTGKMLFGLFDMIKKGIFIKNTRILAIHTGGLQGISGMNKKLNKKKLPLITV